MNSDTYGGWLLAWAVAIIPMSIFGYLAMKSDLSPRLGIVGVLFGIKVCTLMMLLGRCFWKRSKT